MKFIATLHPQAAQSRVWRSRRLRHGVIKGVQFTRAGANYHSAPLEQSELEILQPLHFIKIEVMTAPSEPVTAEDPIAAPAPKPAAKASAGKSAKQISDDELFAPAKK